MRLPARRRLLARSTAVVALVAAGPALAQGMPPLPEPGSTYEYAAPAPRDEMVFTSEPVVQDAHPPMEMHRHHASERAGPPLPPPPAYAPAYAPLPPAPYGAPPMMHGAPSPYQPHGYPMPPQFDRARWLDDCHDRIRGVSRKERAGVIGGLLGAITGGVIGNRAWDSERLAGTLLGGGIGGLAGLAIGSAIGSSGDRRTEDECAWYLDRYMAQPGAYSGHAYGYGYPGYGYAGYTLVPVVVAVPQRQVVREIVTEEWIDEPVRSRSISRRHQHRAAPVADKRIKLIKGK